MRRVARKRRQHHVAQSNKGFKAEAVNEVEAGRDHATPAQETRGGGGGGGGGGGSGGGYGEGGGGRARLTRQEEKTRREDFNLSTSFIAELSTSFIVQAMNEVDAERDVCGLSVCSKA